MWGKETVETRKYYDLRIIPTGVGKSWSQYVRDVPNPDHPHGCGEKLCLSMILGMEDGSSPRVWGKVLLFLFFLFVLRIIPTGVGKRKAQKLDSD